VSNSVIQMKLAIVGSRTFNDYELLTSELADLANSVSEVVSGGSKGADLLAEKWAMSQSIPLKIFKANWERYGRSAGPQRNREIVDYSDHCVAFWDGKSKGTLYTINLFKKHNKPVKIVRI